MPCVPRSRAFELIHPPWHPYAGLPALVSQGTYDAPWSLLWSARATLGGPLGEWLLEHERRGVLPGESRRWLPTSVPMPWRAAVMLADARRRQIVAWGGGAAPWLLSRSDRRAGRRAVQYALGDQTQRYNSLTAAARATGLDAKAIHRHIRDGSADRAGRRWSDSSDFAA